jgi:sulfur-oxidizing protein SoxX
MRRIFRGQVRSIRLLALLAACLAATAAADDPVAEGKVLAFDRGKGNCLACHAIEDGELPGNIGPPLLSMKIRYPDRVALKGQICDATQRNPYTRMPPYCRHGILTEDEVERIVDYLYTL